MCYNCQPGTGRGRTGAHGCCCRQSGGHRYDGGSGTNVIAPDSSTSSDHDVHGLVASFNKGKCSLKQNPRGSLCDAATDATAGAGNERDLSFEFSSSPFNQSRTNRYGTAKAKLQHHKLQRGCAMSRPLGLRNLSSNYCEREATNMFDAKLT
jgi:hypothetical protein